MNRKAVTLVELLVVLAIIGLLLAMFFPAVQAVRERTRETVCKNNIRQFSLAFTMYFESVKILPPPSRPGHVEGWTIELLPFMEQANLRTAFPSDILLVDVSEEAAKQPATFRCPTRSAIEDQLPDAIPSAHYIISTFRGNGPPTGCTIGDAPIDLVTPWLNSPEFFRGWKANGGPHRGGYFLGGSGQNNVSFFAGE